jgi:hypothetical protein
MTTTVTASVDSTTSSPAVKSGYQTSEFLLAVTSLVLTVLGAIFHSDLTKYDAVTGAIVVVVVPTGYALSRAIVKNGVTKGLAMERVALIQTGHALEPIVSPIIEEAVDTSLSHPAKLMEIEARLKAVEALVFPQVNATASSASSTPVVAPSTP